MFACIFKELIRAIPLSECNVLSYSSIPQCTHLQGFGAIKYNVTHKLDLVFQFFQVDVHVTEGKRRAMNLVIKTREFI